MSPSLKSSLRRSMQGLLLRGACRLCLRVPVRSASLVLRAPLRVALRVFQGVPGSHPARARSGFPEGFFQGFPF